MHHPSVFKSFFLGGFECSNHRRSDGRRLDLLAAIGASDTMPRGDTRIARLSARLRLRVVDTPVIGLV